MPNGGRDELCARVFNALVAQLDADGVSAEPSKSIRLFRRFVSRALAVRLLAERGLPLPLGFGLFRTDSLEERLDERCAGERELQRDLDRFWSFDTPAGPREPEWLGARFEALLGYEVVRQRGMLSLVPARHRHRTGSFYTPAALTSSVVTEALGLAAELGRIDEPDFCVCDPACGAGAFLVEVGRQLHARRAGRDPAFDALAAWRQLLSVTLCGVDIDSVALDVARVVLYAEAREPALAAIELGRLHGGDALGGRGFDVQSQRRGGQRDALDFARAFPELVGRGFDLVIGNPPWVAYAGRAAQPLSSERRRALRDNYEGFRGYPTLHGVFVERACRLAPGGVVALLVPSPLADLDGYRPLRRAVTRTHSACEPMLEFGQDAFAGVTQPCFALMARARNVREPVPAELDTRFRLLERARKNGVARQIEEPPVLARLAALEPLPPELFGEMGFQTTRAVSQHLLRRADAPDDRHTYPLLEGRVVSEFVVGRPGLFLRPDAELLKRERCRLRPLDDYQRAHFVVRQTAKVPIAALHASGLPFRNTLLAGFFNEQWPPDLVVGLLNSSLYRALHVARQRDARQATFPQVKIAHLRALPRPPAGGGQSRIRELVGAATRSGPNAELRRELDEAVFDLFSLADHERQSIRSFVHDRVPERESEREES